VTSLILDQLLIVPMVFHVLINGQDTRRKCAQSGDCADDQSLGRSCVRFPQSHAGRSCVWSHACLRACRSRDESRARSRDESRARSRDESRARSRDGSCAWSWGGDFPGSHGRRFSLVVGH